jgi:hypothetical protein
MSRPQCPRGHVKEVGDARVGVASLPAKACLEPSERSGGVQRVLRARPAAVDGQHTDTPGVGSEAGGVLTAMLFLKGADGRPRFTAEEALAFVTGSVGKDWVAGTAG